MKYKQLFNEAQDLIAELQREILRQRRLIDDLLSGDLEPEDELDDNPHSATLAQG